MKTRISKYSAHLQPWPGLRRASQTLLCANSFRDFWHAGIEALERGEAPPGAEHTQVATDPRPTTPIR